MKDILVDTNAWLRYLVQDNDSQFREMVSLMERMKKGEVKLILTNEVLLEVCYVLKSVYKLEREEISKGLSDLVLVKGIAVDSVWKTVLLLYSQKNFSLIDILMKCLAKSNDWDFFTFDKKLQKEVL